ncbi:MAG: ABC transporter permease [Planctomycetaceae bacterium]
MTTPPSSSSPAVTTTPDVTAEMLRNSRRLTRSNRLFTAAFVVIGGTYVVLIILLLAADAAFMVTESTGDHTSYTGRFFSLENPLLLAAADPNIRHAIVLSLISCTLSAIASLSVAIPLGFVMSRWAFPGRQLVDAILDIPIALPPLVIGLSLLILFQFRPFAWLSRDIVYQVPAVIIAQFSVACAFAVRAMKSTFDQIDPRCEQVAITLGCSRLQAFGYVVLPEATRGLVTAFTLAWARSLGEFGPLLVFAGATRMKTEVLSTSVFLELNVGNLGGAVAVSLIMVMAALIVLIITRLAGNRSVTDVT